MNERADSLADIGAHTTTHFRASRPLRTQEIRIPLVHFPISPHPTSHHTFPPDTETQCRTSTCRTEQDVWAEYIPLR